MVSYVLSFIGLILFFLRKIFFLFKLPKLNFQTLNTIRTKNTKDMIIKKEPVIRNNNNLNKEEINNNFKYQLGTEKEESLLINSTHLL